jgi:hypothetical protein
VQLCFQLSYFVRLFVALFAGLRGFFVQFHTLI